MDAEPIPAGQLEVGGKRYMPDAKGSLVPLELVGQRDLLQDQTVRQLLAAAETVAVAIGEFKTKAFADVDAFNEVLAGDYGAKRLGGVKGNITLTSFDGCLRVQVQISERLEFGPEIQAAKALVDECLQEWSADSRAEIRKLVMDAFDVDKEGQLNRSKLFALLRLDITDERWKRAMAAIRDSMKVTGSRRFIRFYRRADPRAEWRPLSLDAASA